tara:strand:- start:1631 stop:2836 length:1206 start_codon:yes stop_codon:yes gene_type:complete
VYKKNFKIGIFWEQFEWGGVDTHIKYLLEGWVGDEDQFIIYYNKGNQGAVRFKNETNLKNIIFKEHKSLYNTKKNYLFFLLEPIKYLTSIIKYFNILKNENLDVIICQNGGYPAAYGVLAALVSAFKLKISVRILVIHHQAKKPILFMNTIRVLLDKITSKISSSIICVSQATLESLKKNTFLLENENTHPVVIYNCVPKLDNLTEKNIFKRNVNEKLIAILGRIDDYKGHQDLIYSFSKLPDSIKKNNKILIIGSGNDEITLKLQKFISKLNLENHVFFKGYINDKIENILKSIDLLVMPTRSFEGFGYTIAEAMSVGTPVLASNVGAIHEFLTKDVGRLFQPGNINELTESIIDFNINNEEWIQKSKKAKVKINKKFNSMKIASEFRNHIDQKYLEGIK